ncbi:hypothetical protein EUTSA_v10013786mg [Eutrema salsugineum]|uniref:KIB1-4 beta-propeller domain-containing protein n=1 Tax=Eutrema salsugineum TaxID=72664 RepID=V4LF25_EUTSA|nr:putative F-box protein At5g60060 [Eutrema salsugineum]ESQ42339.1 hypothetical protein EUTSA_v10013786mg [Eutrema salsugineum]
MDSSLLLPPRWSDLPLDLLELISDRVNDDSSDTVVLLCLRSVCATWRLSLPLSDNNNNPLSKFPILLPFWSATPTSSSSSSGFFILKQSSVYKLEAPHKTLNPKSWLVKLQETSPGKMRVLDLFSNDRICFLPEKFPENIDLQESHVRLVRRAYRMEYANNGGGEMSSFWSLNSDKVVILSSGGASAVMAIHSGGKLGFLKRGNDERWRILDNSWNVIYEDIMMYGENCIVVDDMGKTVIYDVDFNVSDLAEGLAGGGGHKKHLVEFPGGEVLLVDKYVKHVWCKTAFSKSAVEFRVYKLKKEEKRWEEVRELGDVALFVGEDCSFSVQIPAGDLAGGGCIFYRDYRNGGRSRGIRSDGDGVFNVEYETQGDLVFSYKAQLIRPMF